MTSMASSRPEIHIHVNFFYRYGEASSPSLPKPLPLLRAAPQTRVLPGHPCPGPLAPAQNTSSLDGN